MAETPKKAKPVHITFDPDVVKRLDAAAKVMGMTRSAVLGELARWWLDEYGKPAMPHLPIPPRPSGQ